MIRLAAVLLAAALAAGCAAQPEAPPPAFSTPAKAPGGYWRVARAQTAAAMPTSESPYLGQVVALGDTAAGTPSGRFCDHPTYAGGTAVATDILGTAVRPTEAREPMPRSVTAVTCGDEEFGRYLHLDDGALLTRVNDWVLRLEPTPDPAAEAAAAPTAATVPTPPSAVTPPSPPAAKAEGRRGIVYLASYRTKSAALAGWARLVKVAPALNGQTPVTRTVDLGRKGTWVRLFATAADDGERALICRQVAGRVDECGARDRE